jgi:hypothetical protein
MIREDLPTAVYRFFDADNRLLYVGITCNPKMRFRDHQRLSHWWPAQQSVTVDWKDTRGEALAEEAAAILGEDPLHNVIGATTPPARPAMPRTPVHRRPEWVAEVAGQVRAEIARRSSKKPGMKFADELGISRTAWDDRLYGVVEWRITELIEMADLLGVTVDKFLPKRRIHKPPAPLGEEPAPGSAAAFSDTESTRSVVGLSAGAQPGRTSGLVVALPPVAHGGSPGVPPHPGADAFSLPATPPLPRFSVGIATYAMQARRDSRA